jgi:hypothetical protein
MEAQALVTLVVGTVVVLLVPALVWSTSIVRLGRTVRAKIQGNLKAAARKTAVSKVAKVKEVTQIW